MDYRDRLNLKGFDLPDEEMQNLQKILQNHVKKMHEQVRFDMIELNLKKIAKGKSFHHEVKGHVKAGGKILSADASDFNVFRAVSSVLEKMLHEAQHLKRTARQIK